MMEEHEVSGCNATNKSREKRPFNKKKWREQKYSKNQKIEQWQERRKKAALHKYRKVLRKEFNTTENLFNGRPKENEKNTKISKYQEALQEYERKRKEKEEKKLEALRIRAERETARKKSRAERAERNRKLAKKTRKGQPVMRERLQLMLEKIQEKCL